MRRGVGRLFLVICLPVFAQEDLSVRQAVEKALASHPLLNAAAHRMETADALRTQAALTPNPRLVLQHENSRPGSNQHPFVYRRDTDQFAFLQQPIELAGKRDRRVALAETGRERSALERDLLRQQIAARVGTAYWAALGASRLHALLVESAANLRRIVDYHEVRVREGALAEISFHWGQLTPRPTKPVTCCTRCVWRPTAH